MLEKLAGKVPESLIEQVEAHVLLLLLGLRLRRLGRRRIAAAAAAAAASSRGSRSAAAAATGGHRRHLGAAGSKHVNDILPLQRFQQLAELGVVRLGADRVEDRRDVLRRRGSRR